MISLAGLAFAVGMVVEGAIVVSGNIVRLKENGMPLGQAATRGARQVAGALIASTATTVAVFLPVLFLKDVEGQIFADLALTISIAVAISIIVAITVLPAALGFALNRPLKPSGYGEGWPRLTERVLRFTDTRTKQLAWIAGLLVAPLALAWLMLPQLDYLPPVKRAAIDAYFSFPPGMSPEAVNREMVPKLLERMKPYMDGRAEPRLKNWYLLWPGGGTIGARVVDEKRIGELERIMRDKIVVGFPDTRVFTAEGELFGGIGGSARSVGDSPAERGHRGAEPRGTAGTQAAGEEIPRRERASVPQHRGCAAGAARGARRPAHRRGRLGPRHPRHGRAHHGRRRLARRIFRRQAPPADHPARRAKARRPRSSPRRRSSRRPASRAARRPGAAVDHVGPDRIRRLDHRRTVTLTMDPPADAVAGRRAEDHRHAGAAEPAQRHARGRHIRLAGSADSLSQTLVAMSREFVLALLVLFLLMAAMFRSVRDSLIVRADRAARPGRRRAGAARCSAWWRSSRSICCP